MILGAPDRVVSLITTIHMHCRYVEKQETLPRHLVLQQLSAIPLRIGPLAAFRFFDNACDNKP